MEMYVRTEVEWITFPLIGLGIAMANAHQDAKKAAGTINRKMYTCTILIVNVGRLCHPIQYGRRRRCCA
jgi:hypothetical protein